MLEAGQVWTKQLSLLTMLVELRGNLTPQIRTAGKTLPGHSLEAPGVKPKKSLNKSKHSSERKVAGKLKPPGGLCREVNAQRKPLPDSTMGTRGHTEAAAAMIPGQAASKVSQTRCLSHLLLLQTHRYKSGSTVGDFTKVPASSQAR